MSIVLTQLFLHRGVLYHIYSLLVIGVSKVAISCFVT